MRVFFLAISLTIASSGTSFGSQGVTNPCEKVAGWREALCTFSKTHLVHFAWGYEHGIRDYLLSMKLAQEDGLKVDEEVLFAAGLLHDMGGFPPYEQWHSFRTQPHSFGDQRKIR